MYICISVHTCAYIHTKNTHTQHPYPHPPIHAHIHTRTHTHKHTYVYMVSELERNPTLGNMHGDFFKYSGMPACQNDVEAAEVEGKLVEHLGLLSKGIPLLPASNRTVKATSAAITRAGNQGIKLFGVRTDTVDNAVAAIKRLATSSSVTTTQQFQCHYNLALLCVFRVCVFILRRQGRGPGSKCKSQFYEVLTISRFLPLQVSV